MFYCEKTIIDSVILKNDKLKELEEFCVHDPVKHHFALWDLRVDLENTDFYVYWNGKIEGYMLIYSGGSVPSVILNGNKNAIAELLDEVKLKKCVIQMPWEEAPHRNFGGRLYRVDLMSAKPAPFPHQDGVQRIKERSLLEDIFEDPTYLVEKAITFGVVKDGRVISVASALVHLPEVWVIGAVFTRNELRNMGFASKVLSHIVGYSYGRTKNLVLWVRSDNQPAIHIYEKYGFKKVWENVWINVGVDVVP